MSLATVSDLDGIVLTAYYYLDVDGDAVLNPAADRLLGSQELQSTGATSEVAVSTSGFELGTARFLARVVDNQGLYSEVFTATIDVVDAAPRVTKVFVSSTEWTSEFNNVMQQTQGVGGFIILTYSSSQQYRPVPFVNINRIHVQFSEDVVISEGDLALFSVTAAYNIIEFNYDPSTFTATWTLDQFVKNDKLRIVIADTVEDLFGNALDGEWTNPSGGSFSTFPSGNGAAGGNFSFRINVLPGDSAYSTSYLVNSTDTSYVTTRRGWFLDSDSYRADLNGDGIIDWVDEYFVGFWQSAVLPSTDP